MLCFETKQCLSNPKATAMKVLLNMQKLATDNHLALMPTMAKDYQHDLQAGTSSQKVAGHASHGKKLLAAGDILSAVA